ncbi:hypothetical protein PHYSODRAFT_306861 [Phytophthora sojae]|uniref:Uncharacterized protein n=1 Tax=Phytophthora sojae (strain P6497) TaxID=1094619 RepID=G5ABE3_PHYSP|nr:hypothetical protein PHYSODRAFT_306861 [Phytophthora sojae]EGZ06668.1 hypothetical protein PHYSODRAFT_306861 [Phytophthora sojae]|eukprot:XP_009537432.1 hypothetical protein PHYSODRAFT_306861 [Phytophthora sojae]
MGFLGPGEIDIRTAFGWVSSGKRESGLGQGSVLSIRLIGYYMAVLMQRQDQGPDAVIITHSQGAEPHQIASTVLVDDVIDVATTRSGIEHRVAVSKVFTGIHGTGGVFGASKSFLLQFTPTERSASNTVYLHDGTGQPRAVTIVIPAEGFKHLGIIQSTDDVWSATLAPVWNALRREADIITRLQLTHDQLQYIVNHVWLPRVQYRAQLNTSHKIAKHVDILIRRVAKHVLKLPHSTPKDVFHDETRGLGLASFEDMCNVARAQLAIRVMNSPHLSAYHLLTEAFEIHLQRWIHQTIRAVVAVGSKVDVTWENPQACTTNRPNDRPICNELTEDLRALLLRYNLKYSHKVRYVGDIANTSYTRLEQPTSLQRKFRWSRQQVGDYKEIDDDIKAVLCQNSTGELITPVGRIPVDRSYLHIHSMDVGPGQFFIAREFDITDEGLEMRGHELGKRVDDIWWQETRPNSGVWKPRPGEIGSELANICVPVEVVYLRRRGGRSAKDRVIIWSDTSTGGVIGVMSRDLIREAFNRSSRNYDEVMATEELQSPAERVASAIGAKTCTTRPVRIDRRPWVHWEEFRNCENCIAAGDRSVCHGGTPSATSGWGLRTGTVRKIGRIAVHWADMTSTRCECHALIAGLMASGDTGTQVCDNLAAIRTLETARAIANGIRSSHLKYSNKHRVKIRTMVALMRPGGTFTAQWVRPHQEHELTSDPTLNEQRRALAAADADAAQSHDPSMTGSYIGIMCWDAAHIMNSHGNPVVGRIQLFLTELAAEKRKSTWIEVMGTRGEHRQTACDTDLNMAKLLGWDDYQKCFYWRSITKFLHTNLRKHRSHTQWGATLSDMQPMAGAGPTQSQPIGSRSARNLAGTRVAMGIVCQPPSNPGNAVLQEATSGSSLTRATPTSGTRMPPSRGAILLPPVPGNGTLGIGNARPAIPAALLEPEPPADQAAWQAVSQTSSTERRNITANNPSPVWIGIITPHITQAQQHCWASEWWSALQCGLYTDWLIIEYTSEDLPEYGPRQALVTWNAALATTGADPVLLETRRWLQNEFLEVYSAPCGWKTWPSATPATVRWAQYLMVTSAGGTRLHLGVLRSIWMSNRLH